MRLSKIELKRKIKERERIINELEKNIKKLEETIEKLTGKTKKGKEIIMQRRKVIERDNGRCRICNSDKYLEVHHLKPKILGGDETGFNKITLCTPCHLFMHCNPLLVQLQKRIHREKTRRGVENARKNGKMIGKRGKDKKPRKKRGVGNWQ